MATRRRSCLPLAIATALFVAAPAPPAIAAQGPSDGEGFAKRVAGSYFLDLTVVGFPPLKVLITLGVDGTMSSEDTTDYGLFAPYGGPAFEGENRGSWRRSGRYGVTFNSIGFIYADDGSLAGVGRLWGNLEFEKGFDAFSSAGQHDIFFQGQDPLDPDAVPDDLIPWTATGRRIPAILE